MSKLVLRQETLRDLYPISQLGSFYHNYFSVEKLAGNKKVGFCIVISGCVQVLSADERIIAVLSAGQFIGDVASINHELFLIRPVGVCEICLLERQIDQLHLVLWMQLDCLLMARDKRIIKFRAIDREIKRLSLRHQGRVNDCKTLIIKERIAFGAQVVLHSDCENLVGCGMFAVMKNGGIFRYLFQGDFVDDYYLAGFNVIAVSHDAVLLKLRISDFKKVTSGMIWTSAKEAVKALAFKEVIKTFPVNDGNKQYAFPTEMEMLATLGIVVYYPQNSVVISKGFNCYVYCNLQGRIEVKTGENVVILENLGWFGDLSCCRNLSLDMECKAMDDCVLLRLTYPAYKAYRANISDTTLKITPTHSIYDNMVDIPKALQACHQFTKVPQEVLEEVARSSYVHACTESSMILKEGRFTEPKLLLLVRGRANARWITKNITLRQIGQLFGDAPDSPTNVRLYSVVADSNCVYLEMKSPGIEAIRTFDPDIIDRINCSLERLSMPPSVAKRLYYSDMKVQELYENECEPLTPPVNLEKLTPALLKSVVGFLSLKDKLTMRLVCHTWKNWISKHLDIQIMHVGPILDLERFLFFAKTAGTSLLTCHFSRSLVNCSHLRLLATFCPNISYLNLSGCKDTINSSAVKLVAAQLPVLKTVLFPQINADAGLLSRCSWQFLETFETCKWKVEAVSKGTSAWHSVMTDFAIGNPIVKNVVLSEARLFNDESMRALVSGCKYIVTLDLSRCVMLTDQALFHIANNLLNLKKLNVELCQLITDAGFSSFQGTSIQLVDLNVSWLPGVSDALFLHLRNQIGKLEQLSIRHCKNITTEGLRILSSRALLLKQISLSGISLDPEKLRGIFSSGVNIHMQLGPRLTSSLTAEYVPLHNRYRVSTNGSYESIIKPIV